MNSKKYFKSKSIVDFDDDVKKLLNRYERLKERYSHPQDTSNKIYNKSIETIKVASSVIKTKMERGTPLNKGEKEFIREVKKYGNEPTIILDEDIIKERKSLFFDRLKEISEKDVKRAYYLLHKMNEDDYKDFFLDESFFINKKPDSIPYLTFNDEHDYSLEIARLEDFMKQRGYKVRSQFDMDVEE